MPRNKLNPLDQKIRLEISNNLKKYSRGITQASLSDKTGIPVSTLSGYFAQRSTPNAGTIQKIAEALGVNKSDLDPRYRDSSLISVETSDINKIYNALTPDRQQNVYNFASKQLAEQSNKVVPLNPNKAVIDVDGVLSAGIGEYLDDSTQKFTAEVQKPIPDDYDFAFEINGESMEPVYHDQQIVFVKHLDEYRDGQIVAAISGSDAYLKKLKIEDNKLTLMSINTKYPNVSVNEQDNLKILGVVYA